MHIHTLRGPQYKLWRDNVSVLVDSETGEAVMENGQPRTINQTEVVELLKAQRRKKLFSVTVDGRECHFVRGRSYLAREFARAHGGNVMLRSPNGITLEVVKPKFPNHDRLSSPCTPVESARPVDPSIKVVTTAGETLVATGPIAVPRPEHCPECASFAKPIGCRPDEHHFVCRHHDAYERIYEAEKRAEQAEAEKAETAPLNVAAPVEVVSVGTPDVSNTIPAPPAGQAWVIALTGTPGERLRLAEPDEIAEAEKFAEVTGFPMIERGGVQYGISFEAP